MRLLALIPAALSALLLALPSHAAQKPALAHARDVVRFFSHHPAQARTAQGARAVLRAARTLDTEVRSLQAADAAKEAVPYWPPHHALWLCIHQYEEPNWHPTEDVPAAGAYATFGGGLAMMRNWGSLRGNASYYSQHDQEWAAENAWRDAGYSYGFLYGNWYEWDNADGCGTTG